MEGKRILRLGVVGLVALGGFAQGFMMYSQQTEIQRLELQRIRQEERIKGLEDRNKTIMQEERDSAEVLCVVANVVGQAILGLPPVDCNQAKNGVSGQLPDPEPTPLPIPKFSS